MNHPEQSEPEADTPFCRIAKAPDGRTLVLGFDSGVLTPGHVYHLHSVLGEIVVRDMGPSAAVADPNAYPNWKLDATFMIEGATNHLLTPEEYQLKITKG